MKPTAQTDGASAPMTWSSRIAWAIVLVWAAGTLGAEGVEQGAALAALAFAAIMARRGGRVAEDLRPFALVTLALAAWQGVSPLISLAAGTAPHLPRSGRWTQALDALAPLTLATVAALGVPWRGLGWLLGIGWGAQAAVGLFQSLVQWPWESLGPLRFPMSRLRETFGEEGAARRAGLGLFFHRLRYAHGAVAALGPALALAGWGSPARRRVWGAVATACLLGCAWLSFARAALGAGLAVAFLGALLLPGRGRTTALGALLAGAVVLTASPAWRHRLAEVPEHLLRGERSETMAVGWTLAMEHPLLGVGFGGYKLLARPLQPGPEATADLLATDAHNLLLTVWAETGLLGLLLLLMQHTLLARALWRRARGGSIVAAGALLSMAGFHLLGLVHYLPYHSGVMLSFAFVWGLGLAPPPQGLVARASS